MERDFSTLIPSQNITASKRNRMLKAIERFVNRLTDHQMMKDLEGIVTELDLHNIFTLLPDVLINEPACLQLSLENPLYIVGDVRGQFSHLMHIFNGLGHPTESSYLFLGNYTDFGVSSVETLALLFAYKLLHPNKIYLLRGKHECDVIARKCGLYDLVVKQFTGRIWDKLTNAFDFLPIAALIDNRILCVHSGLSPVFDFIQISSPLQLQEQINQSVIRPIGFQRHSIITHLVWSDPDEDVKEWEQNPRGMGYLFGPDVVAKVCNRVGLLQIIRSGEMIRRGFSVFQEPRMLTIFSAPNFNGVYENDAAVLQLYRYGLEEVRCRIKVMKPVLRRRSRQAESINMLPDDIYLELGRKASLARIA